MIMYYPRDISDLEEVEQDASLEVESEKHQQTVAVTLCSTRRASYYVAMIFSTPSSPFDVVIFVSSRD